MLYVCTRYIALHTKVLSSASSYTKPFKPHIPTTTIIIVGLGKLRREHHRHVCRACTRRGDVSDEGSDHPLALHDGQHLLGRQFVGLRRCHGEGSS